MSLGVEQAVLTPFAHSIKHRALHNCVTLMAPPERLPAVGDLHLQLHATSFFAGDELSGTIRLSLNQAVRDARKQFSNGSFCCSWESN
jgi:hypothetical protein